MRKVAFEAIGTKWSIEVFEDIPRAKWSALIAQIHKRIEQFDQTYSRFRSDSLVTRMSQKAGRYELPADAFKLLAFYEQLYRLSDRQLTPLIGQVLADAGYDANYSFKSKPLKRPPAWKSVVEYDRKSIELKQPVLIDFGAAGKGYLVDIVASMMEGVGIKNFVINASGDILHRSDDSTPVKIGLENPLDTSEAIGIISLDNQSLCASAGSRRQWGKYSHILNPRTLESPKDTLATWVVASDTMSADGLATALFFTNPAILKKHFDFAYAILDKDMQLSYSKDLMIEVFSS